MLVGRGVFEKLLASWDFHAQQTLDFTQNGVENKNISIVLKVEGLNHGNVQIGSNWQEG